MIFNKNNILNLQINLFYILFRKIIIILKRNSLILEFNIKLKTIKNPIYRLRYFKL